MTLKKIKAARNRAERRAVEWHDKRETELVWHYVNIRGDMVSLIDTVVGKKYRAGVSVADILEGAGLPVYEEDDDDEDFGVYHECTRRVISRLRRIEQKLQEWNNKYYFLDCAVDEWNSPQGISEGTARGLAALGITL